MHKICEYNLWIQILISIMQLKKCKSSEFDNWKMFVKTTETMKIKEITRIRIGDDLVTVDKWIDIIVTT